MAAFTKDVTDTVNLNEGSGLGLRFDGVSSRLNMGSLGNLGSSLASGLYIEFDIQTKQASSSFGYGRFATNVSSRFWVELGTSVALQVGDTLQAGLAMKGSATSYSTLNDGRKHNVKIQAYPSTNVLQITIDDVVQTVTMTLSQSPVTFANFTGQVHLGVENRNQFNNNFAGYFAGIIDNFKIGTSPSNIYATYNFNSGSSPVADQSGNGNTGTLAGTTPPQYVVGLDAPLKEVSANRSDTLSLVETLVSLGVFARELVVDSITLTESFIKNILNTFSSDNVTHTETISRSGVYARSFTETLSLNETLTRLSVVARTFAESINLSDTMNQVRSIFFKESVHDSFLGTEDGIMLGYEDGVPIALNGVTVPYFEELNIGQSKQSFIDSINLVEYFIYPIIRKMRRSKLILKLRERLKVLN